MDRRPAAKQKRSPARGGKIAAPLGRIAELEAALREARAECARLRAQDDQRAAQEAQKTASTLRALLDSMADEVWACDADGNMTLLNAITLPGIGLSPPEHEREPLTELAPKLEILRPDGTRRSTEEAPLLRSLKGELLHGEEYFRHLQTGELRHRQYTSAPVRDGSGRIVGAVAVVRDITAQTQAQAERERLIKTVAEREASLRAEQEAAAEREKLLRAVEQKAAEVALERDRLRALVESIADEVWFCDDQGNLTLLNAAAVAGLGLQWLEQAYPAVLEVASKLEILLPDGRPRPPERAPLLRSLQGETVKDEEEIIRHLQTGELRYRQVSSAPVRESDGTIVGAVAVVKDVTERTALDRLKDQFIAVAAHELKTPVAIMKGYAQTLLRRADGVTPQARRMLEAIDRGADRIAGVVQDLLDISKLHAGRLELEIEPIDLPGLVAEVADRVALGAEKHRIRVGETVPVVVHGDRGRLEQVLSNLLDNAIKYSPGGGDVEIAVAVGEREATVSVRDHGIGIPKEKQQRIFQRFYSAHTGTPFDYGGMGVGLYISNEIVARHGGWMWFESEEGKGSAFHFSLPL